jgi:hypothetical protein
MKGGLFQFVGHLFLGAGTNAEIVLLQGFNHLRLSFGNAHFAVTYAIAVLGEMFRTASAGHHAAK